jgi:hypothetical protein
MTAPVDVLAVLADHAKLWGVRGNVGYEGDLILARAAVAELVEAAREHAASRCALIYAGLIYDEEAHRTGSRMQEANHRLDVALAKFGGAQ